MKTIGLLGGMSWESTLLYYRLINEFVRDRMGGLHSADCLIYSVDFRRIATMQHDDRWDDLTDELITRAQQLEAGGAELLLICANTMHKLADAIEMKIGIPLVHIADAAAVEITRSKMGNIGLLGTRFTMEEDFYKLRLEQKHGVSVIIPDPSDRQEVHRVIYDELVKGVFRDSSRTRFLSIIERLMGVGAEGVLLGCTEIPLLVRAKDTPYRLFDSTFLHARAAVDAALIQMK